MSRKAKLTPEQAERVRWYYRHTDMGMAAIGRRFDVTTNVVKRVLYRESPYDQQTPEPEAAPQRAQEAEEPEGRTEAHAEIGADGWRPSQETES